MEEKVKYSVHKKSEISSENWLMINKHLDEEYYVYKLDKTIRLVYVSNDNCIKLYMFKSLPDAGYICIFYPNLWAKKLNISIPKNVTEKELFFIVATELVERFSDNEIF